MKEDKEKFKEKFEYFTFEGNRDLSGGVDVIPHNSKIYEAYKSKASSMLASDMACMMSSWFTEVYPTLKSFNGMDTVKWNIYWAPDLVVDADAGVMARAGFDRIYGDTGQGDLQSFIRGFEECLRIMKNTVNKEQRS